MTDPRRGSTFWIEGKQVTAAAFFRHANKYKSSPVPRVRSARRRKLALISSRPLVPCEHDYVYHEDTIGDYGVVNGTYTERWLQCEYCDKTLPATYEDAPSYDDYDY